MASVWRWLAPLLLTVSVALWAWARAEVRPAVVLSLSSLSPTTDCAEAAAEPEEHDSPAPSAEELGLSAFEADDDLESHIALPCPIDVDARDPFATLDSCSVQRGPPPGSADRDVPPPRRA